MHLSPKTLGDLLNILSENPPHEFPALRTACTKLADYLDKGADQITIDAVDETKDGFRQFLESRTFAENTIRKNVDSVRMLLKIAGESGWRPNEEVPEAWRGVVTLAPERRCADTATYFSRIRKAPKDVTIEDVDAWAQMRVQQGLSFGTVRSKKTWFWRLLRDWGCTTQAPMCFLREKKYGIPLKEFPPGLMKEVQELQRWKGAEFVRDRPKEARHTPVTAKRLQAIICKLLGYAVNELGRSDISSLSQLVQEGIVGDFAEWCINERKVNGRALQGNLRLLSAAMSQHPSYKSSDFSWLRTLLNRIPTEPKSLLRRRKAEKSLEYKVVESIPAKIRAERCAAERRGSKKGIDRVALLAMYEFLITWLLTLPWRQRNIRECRIGGSNPNLFKGKILPFLDIDKPEWVQQEERENPEAKFWQCRFSCDETKTGTKTGIEVHFVLPRPLIGPLEEFLNKFRPRLLQGADSGTLFVNQAGKPMSLQQVGKVVSDLTLRHGGRRVTPHLFRDIFAFAWLKDHPEDYLNLSKSLWHASLAETINTYGSKYNESSGVVATEEWLEERAKKPKETTTGLPLGPVRRSNAHFPPRAR